MMSPRAFLMVSGKRRMLQTTCFARPRQTRALMDPDGGMMGRDETARGRARTAGATPPAGERLPTVADVARLAGVSTATVDRVLHGRPNVRPLTAQRVLRAAASLKALPEGALARGAAPPMEIVFLLPSGTNRYLKLLGDAVGWAEPVLRPLNVRCRVDEVDSFDPGALAQALLHHGRGAQGVAFMGVEHPLVRDAVRTLAARGVRVVTLISDLADAPRLAYVGIDNRSAGRTAALLIGRLARAARGEVAMIAGSLAYRGHEEREMGFRGLMREAFPGLEVIGLFEGRDDAGSNYRHARALLERHPKLVGLYNIGGAADGVGRAIRESGRAGRVVFVAHGLTPDTRALLIDGTLDALLTQSPQAMVHAAVSMLANARDGRDPSAGVEPVRFSVVMRENLP
jgi:LacI family transcriptional regulator